MDYQKLREVGAGWSIWQAGRGDRRRYKIANEPSGTVLAEGVSGGWHAIAVEATAADIAGALHAKDTAAIGRQVEAARHFLAYAIENRRWAREAGMLAGVQRLSREARVAVSPEFIRMRDAVRDVMRALPAQVSGCPWLVGLLRANRGGRAPKGVYVFPWDVDRIALGQVVDGMMAQGMKISERREGVMHYTSYALVLAPSASAGLSRLEEACIDLRQDEFQEALRRCEFRIAEGGGLEETPRQGQFDLLAANDISRGRRRRA